MGILDEFTRLLRSKTPGQINGIVNGREVTATAFMSAQDGVEGYSVEAMWKSQPNLRTVVDFQARSISQLGLHLFQRTGDEVARVRTGKVADTLRKPNGDDTMSELIYSLVGEWALYDNSYLAMLPNDDGGTDLRVFPAAWVTPVMKNSFTVSHYLVNGVDGSVSADRITRFKGWTPGDPKKGTSPVETLRLILEEQHHARIYRKQIWKHAGRFGGFLTRPKDAPGWDNAARKRFYKMWEAFTGDKGERAGQDPLLEDGMEYKRTGFAAKEDQFVESAKLSLETVAQVYHVNPTMIGMLDNANYSNVREFRRGLYGDTLGPIIKMIEDRFNTFVLPALGAEEGQYVEFNVEAMLRGSFEEQAGVVSTATGAPWQTRNEARKLFNLPAVEGGDELITPLNVLIGGQASPQDGGEATGGQNSVEDVLRKFLTRQASAVLARKNVGKVWWDRERWDRELAQDLDAAGHKSLSFLLPQPVNDAAHAMYQGGAADPEPLVRQALEVMA